MMPEGPEVSSFVHNLNNQLFPSDSQYHLTDLQIVSGRYSKATPVGYDDMKALLPVTLNSIRSKGKFIYFDLDGFSLWSTLGLQGYWVLFPNSKPIKERNNLRLICKFTTNNDHNQYNLVYYDTIGYGTLKICMNELELKEKLESLGQCWVHDPISLQDFMSLIKKAKPDRYLAVFLMDQSKTAGIGNYILAEALYMSRIYPWILCGQIAQSKESIELLYESILTIIRSSYTSQISLGPINHSKYNEQFEFKVYMRESCPLGHRVVKEPGPHKRSIHWVPNVQINTFHNSTIDTT